MLPFSGKPLQLEEQGNVGTGGTLACVAGAKRGGGGGRGEGEREKGRERLL